METVTRPATISPTRPNIADHKSTLRGNNDEQTKQEEEKQPQDLSNALKQNKPSQDLSNLNINQDKEPQHSSNALN